MKRTLKGLLIFGLLVVTMVGVSVVVAADSMVVSVDKILVAVVAAPGETTALVPVTAENVGGDGARGFDITFNYDKSNITLDLVGSLPGTDMAALNCGFALAETYNDPASNNNYVSGFCNSAGSGAALGNIELAQLRFDLTGTAGEYPIAITPVFFGEPSVVRDGAGNPATPSMGYADGSVDYREPTAVAFSGVDASSTANPAAPGLALWPLLVGGAAVAAGGGLALLRRKR